MHRLRRQKKSPETEPCSDDEIADQDPDAYGLKEVNPGINPDLDIVAVHGLNGHRDRTWTAKNGVNWLKDLLPKKQPNARIFTYGYDARTHAFEALSEQYLHDHAIGLVGDLSLHRRATKTERRPIIFIAHSLGGIIVKSALIHANTCHRSHLPAHKNIHLSTYGILFFGTPHQGGNGVSLGKLLANVASVVAKTNTRLLKHMEMHSELLQQQTAQYNAISSTFETKFLYEVYPTETPLGSEVVVPKYSAVIPGAVNAEEIPISENHRNMVRFPSENNGFMKVSQHLNIMVDEATEKIEERWNEYEGVAAFPAFSFPSAPTTDPKQRSNAHREWLRSK